MTTVRFGCEDTTLSPGQTVLVPIVVEFDQPTKVRSISADFRGYEESKADYTVSSTDSKGKTTTSTETAVQRVTIVEQELQFFGEKVGFFRGMGDALATMVGGGNCETLDPGSYEYELEVAIPETAPATMKGKKCKVAYELSVTVDRPAKLDKAHRLEFLVQHDPIERTLGKPFVVERPESYKRGFFDKLFGKKARMRLALENNRFYFGDQIHGLFQMEAEEQIRFEKITARLVGMEKTRADGHTDSAMHQEEVIVLCQSSELRPDDAYSAEFDLPVSISGPTTTVGTNFTVDWQLEVQVDVAWAADPVIRASVSIYA